MHGVAAMVGGLHYGYVTAIVAETQAEAFTNREEQFILLLRRNSSDRTVVMLSIQRSVLIEPTPRSFLRVPPTYDRHAAAPGVLCRCLKPVAYRSLLKHGISYVCDIARTLAGSYFYKPAVNERAGCRRNMLPAFPHWAAITRGSRDLASWRLRGTRLKLFLMTSPLETPPMPMANTTLSPPYRLPLVDASRVPLQMSA